MARGSASFLFFVWIVSGSFSAETTDFHEAKQLQQEAFPLEEAQAPVVVDQIVAVVNDRIILLSDLHRDRIFFEYEAAGSIQEQIEKRVEHQLLLDEAKRFILIPPSEDEVDDAVKKIRQRFKGKDGFQDRLREAGMTLLELREEVEDRVWIKTLLRDRIGFFIFVTKEEEDQYYIEHQDDFKEKDPEERSERIRAILEAEKEKVKTREYISHLKSQAKIQVNLR